MHQRTDLVAFRIILYLTPVSFVDESAKRALASCAFAAELAAYFTPEFAMGFSTPPPFTPCALEVEPTVGFAAGLTFGASTSTMRMSGE